MFPHALSLVNILYFHNAETKPSVFVIEKFTCFVSLNKFILKWSQCNSLNKMHVISMYTTNKPTLWTELKERTGIDTEKYGQRVGQTCTMT